MSRKTIKVAKVVEFANTLLAASLNTPEERDHPTMRGMRRGAMRMVEMVLQETDNSIYFGYRQCDDDQQTRDDTLRKYFMTEGSFEAYPGISVRVDKDPHRA